MPRAPVPLISFFRDKGKEAEKGVIKVWVANMEEGTIGAFYSF